MITHERWRIRRRCPRRNHRRLRRFQHGRCILESHSRMVSLRMGTLRRLQYCNSTLAETSVKQVVKTRASTFNACSACTSLARIRVGRQEYNGTRLIIFLVRWTRSLGWTSTSAAISLAQPLFFLRNLGGILGCFWSKYHVVDASHVRILRGPILCKDCEIFFGKFSDLFFIVCVFQMQ